jgi:arylsulfatase A-like enzyme
MKLGNPRSHPTLHASLFAALIALCCPTGKSVAADRPNIVFAVADDWGWPHAGIYGDKVVKTPAFDRVAREGVLFNHAYVSSPSCTPSRGSILTGMHHWQLEAAANLWSVFPDQFEVYPEILEKSGYATGLSGKGWGPGRTETADRDIAGKRFKGFQQFLAQRPEDKPFVYWLGTSDPHRPFKKDAWKATDMDLSKVHLFGHYPDAPEVRGDVADYYVEVQRWDSLVASAIRSLEKIGELDNTIIVMTGDHGMPFPRCKSNNYDSGARVPLAIRWGAKVKGERVVDDFVSLIDLAPTFLEAAGVEEPEEMTGRSLMTILESAEQGRLQPEARGFVIHGKERHVPAQEAPDMGGYPSRAIRNHRFLYIRNYQPDRWPAGTPHHEKATIKNAWLADCDNGPTKTYIVENKDKDDAHRRAYDLCFAKRPAEELYDLGKDTEQLNNVAAEKSYANTKAELSARLTEQLKSTHDPRETKTEVKFEDYNYLGGAPKFEGE